MAKKDDNISSKEQKLRKYIKGSIKDGRTMTWSYRKVNLNDENFEYNL